jgi:hypothetical protein
MKKKFLTLATGVLICVMALVLYINFFTNSQPQIKEPLPKLIPEKADGWTITELPLAETETMNKIVANVLQMDSHIYRLYKKGNLEVSLYAAYWEPGKISTTDAGVHNPDSCWVNSGWKRLQRQYSQLFSVDGKKLKPLEYGLYQRTTERGETITTPVIFWHLVGDETNNYKQQKKGFRSGLMGRIDRLPLVFADLKKYGLNQKREQMFVRITASESFEKLFANPDFIRLVETWRPLGIFEGNNWKEPGK